MRESEAVQSCPTLSDPMDYSPPGSSIHGIFQARVLEWGAIAFSNEYGTSIEIFRSSLISLSKILYFFWEQYYTSFRFTLVLNASLVDQW